MCRALNRITQHARARARMLSRELQARPSSVRECTCWAAWPELNTHTHTTPPRVYNRAYKRTQCSADLLSALLPCEPIRGGVPVLRCDDSPAQNETGVGHARSDNGDGHHLSDLFHRISALINSPQPEPTVSRAERRLCALACAWRRAAIGSAGAGAGLQLPYCASIQPAHEGMVW